MTSDRARTVAAEFVNRHWGWRDGRIEYELAIALDAFANEAAEQEREACAKVADEWSRADALLLAAGEMQRQELRTGIAIAKGIARRIRALPSTPSRTIEGA